MYTINLSMGEVVAVSKALPNVTDTGEGVEGVEGFIILVGQVCPTYFA